MTKTVAVIITVHNRKEKTLRCLELLFANTSNHFKIKVYLTDDGSTDGTGDSVAQLYPEVIIIRGNGSLFWNRGMRYAWEYAAQTYYDYYLWLNDDTAIMDDSISRLVNWSKESNDKCIIVGSTCSSKDNTLLSYGGRQIKRNHPLIKPDNISPIECSVFNGNIVLIPYSVFEKIGFNDNYYRHSFGDFDYGIMAMKNGIKSLIAPGYYGYCERNNPVPLFRRKCYRLTERYKMLYSPRGYNPIEDFHFNKKFRPLWQCIWYFMKLHLNVLFPKDHLLYEKN